MTIGRPIMRAVNSAAGVVVYFRPSCKRWSCPQCAVVNARKWRYVATYGAEWFERCGYPLSFITLTSHERRRGQDASIELFRSAFPILRKRLGRTFGVVEYFAIPETHVDGTTHLHALVVGFLETGELKDMARSCGLGYMADSEVVVSIGQVTNYVTKYMAKDIRYGNWPKGFRRVRVSQTWPARPDFDTLDDWEMSIVSNRGRVRSEMQEQAEKGFRVVDTDHAEAWAIVRSVG